MSDQIQWSTVTVRTVGPPRLPTQDEYDAMDDSERASVDEEIAQMEALQQRLSRAMTEHIDRMLENALLGRPPGLPSDPSHYTPSEDAVIVDVGRSQYTTEELAELQSHMAQAARGESV